MAFSENSQPILTFDFPWTCSFVGNKREKQKNIIKIQTSTYLVYDVLYLLNNKHTYVHVHVCIYIYIYVFGVKFYGDRDFKSISSSVECILPIQENTTFPQKLLKPLLLLVWWYNGQ